MAYNYSYHLSSRACADLEDILNYLSLNLSNPAAASKFWNAMKAVIQETQMFPFSGAAANPVSLQGVTVRKKFVNQYVMFYLADSKEKRITILRIVHGRQNTQEILRGLDL